MTQWNQTYPNDVGFSEETFAVSCSHLKMVLLSVIWLSSWLYTPRKPLWWRRISAAWGLCVRSLCGGAGGWRRGGRRQGSTGITMELKDKRDIVALTDPSKKTLLPVPSAQASSPHELLTSQNRESLFEHHLLFNAHVVQRSVMTICRQSHLVVEISGRAGIHLIKIGFHFC